MNFKSGIKVLLAILIIAMSLIMFGSIINQPPQEEVVDNSELVESLENALDDLGEQLSIAHRELEECKSIKNQ